MTTTTNEIILTSIIDYIRNYRLANHAISPSLREIQRGVGISSTSEAARLIGILIHAGQVGRIDEMGVARGLYLMDGSDIPVREGQ